MLITVLAVLVSVSAAAVFLWGLWREVQYHLARRRREPPEIL